MWHCLVRHAAPPLQATPSAVAAPVALRRCFARKTARGGDRRGTTDGDLVGATGTSVSGHPNSGKAAFVAFDGQPGQHASTSASLPLKYGNNSNIDQSEARWLWDNETGGGIAMGVRAPQHRWRKAGKGMDFEPPGKGKSFASDSEEDDEVMPFRRHKGGKSTGFGPLGKGKSRSFVQSDSEEDDEGKGKNNSFAQSDSKDDDVMPFRGHRSGNSMSFGPSGKGKNRSFAQSDSEEDDEVMTFHGRTASKGTGGGPSGKGKNRSFMQSDSEDDEEVMPHRWPKGKGKHGGATDPDTACDSDKISKPLAHDNRTTGRDNEAGHRWFTDSDDDKPPLSRGVQGANTQPKGVYSPRGEAVRLKARPGSLDRRSYPDSDDEFFGAHKGSGGRSKGSDGGMGFGGVPSGKGRDGKHGRFDSMSFASDFSQGKEGKSKGFDSMEFGTKGRKGPSDFSKGKEGKSTGFDSMEFGTKGRKGRDDSFFDSGKFGKSKGGKDHSGKSKAGKGQGFKGKGTGYF